MVLTYKGRYQIRTVGNGLCYELFEMRVPRRGGKVLGEEKWASLGKYPSTLSAALWSLYRHIERTQHVECADLREACAYVEGVTQALRDDSNWLVQAGEGDE